MTSPPERKKSVDELTDAELVRELARRRARHFEKGGFLAAEDAAESQAHEYQHEMLEEVLESRMRQQTRSAKPCPKCGRPAGVKTADRPRTVRTMSGEMTLFRHYHYCEPCRSGFYPLDQELGLPVQGELSAKMMARVLDFGVTTVFGEAAERWSVHHSGAPISENMVRRVVERQGNALEALSPEQRAEVVRPAPTTPASLLVVQVDGSMIPMRQGGEWKEAKLGVVYRDDEHVPTGSSQRGQLSSPRYTGSLQGIADFREELDHALVTERVDEAAQVAWVGDGAPWVWNLREDLCLQGIEILDYMHMKEHAAECGKAVLGPDSPWLNIWVHSIVARIDDGRLDDVLQDLRDLQGTLRGTRKKAVTDLLRYYENNAHRMNYSAFRDAGLPIGSGAIESSHRHVLQRRMKLAGQHWSEPGAHRMARLRCAYKTSGPAKFAQTVLAVAA